ncbi:MAG: sodium:alanine symporter family protein [Phycisphaerales bacterium]|nr:sodium:alanine symporter family protein [Phycisphaerales bacterium]
MESINNFVNTLNGYLFSDFTVYALLFTGVLFTIWSGFGQYRALTHGVGVVRGKYDDGKDPGAINHFQALSAALSATVGLGNIAGVAVAVAIGGPGAILWMWLIGVLGMGLKMTEVTQSMLYRNTDDPDNPHGGPMFVVKNGFKKWGLGPLGAAIGAVFVVTLITSAITGGNMFQAWNVADVTATNFQIPQIVSGIILAIVVGLVIIGGIKRIGAVAGRIVPFMCVIYLMAAAYVLIVHFADIPGMLALIVKSGLPTWMGGESADATGAFLGGTFGFAALWGIKRALFSSEAGQGSAPIAHSAAKTDEPAREGVVAGLEPFIDTIVVCTMTALVILASGAYNRGPETDFSTEALPTIVSATERAGELDQAPTATLEDGDWTLGELRAPPRTATASETRAAENEGKALPDWQRRDQVFVYATASPGDRQIVVSGSVTSVRPEPVIRFNPIKQPEDQPAYESITVDTVINHGSAPSWTIRSEGLPTMSAEGRRIRQTREGESGWRADENVFMVVHADHNRDRGGDLTRILGRVVRDADNGWTVAWRTTESVTEPRFRTLDDGSTDYGVYGDYAGASLTAHAFDRVQPGLGKWLVTIAAWLFAVSTMISWSYYGEQGVYYFCLKLNKATTNAVVLVYKFIYCALIFLTTVAAMNIFTASDGSKQPLIGTDEQLDMWTTLGLGVMLVVNIPIMLIFGAQAMKSYHEYIGRLKRGELDPHPAPPITDVAEGKDVRPDKDNDKA